MTADLPEPLVPAECDLRGLAFMPLDVTRLMDSDIFAISTGDEFKAAIACWCKAWTQVPAGSLPDDDRVLAHLTGAGAKWKRVKAMALRGFVKCADGRLYHPVVCEKALQAWEMRQRQRDRSARGNATRWGSPQGGAAPSPQDHSAPSPSDPTGDPHGDARGDPTRDPSAIPSAIPTGIARDRDRDRDKENPESSLRSDSGAAIETAVAAWNGLATDLGLSRVQRLNPARKAKLAARLRDCGGLAGWEAALAKIRGSPFLRGERRDWRANFDFVLQESSFIKLLEGAYDDHRANGGASDAGEIDAAIRRGLGLDRVPADGTNSGGDGELFAGGDRGG